MLRTILGVTFACEAIGALALLACWWGEHGFGRALWLAIFHSVSAFCNAGFSLFSENLIGQQRHASVLGVVALLIVVGGIGFPVLHDLRARLRGKRRLTTHSRIVLVATSILIVFGTGGFLLFEWDRALASLGLGDRFVNALFMSITPRTAGFNAVDYGAISNDSLLLTMALMWIGGGPGSVAGGVKVTTVSLLALLVWARWQGDEHVSVAGRTVPDETVNRATGLAVGMVLILLAVHAGDARVRAGRARSRRRSAPDGDPHLRGPERALHRRAVDEPDADPRRREQARPRARRCCSGVSGRSPCSGAMVRRSHRSSFRYPHEDVLIG